MAKILIVTAILPVAAIEYKRSENDIILVTEDRLNEQMNDVTYKYIFIFPFANRLLSFFSEKWKSYYTLRNKSNYVLRGRVLFLLPLLLFPKRFFVRHCLVKISLYFQRKRIKQLFNEFHPTLIHAQGADASASVARVLSTKYKIPYIVTLRDLQHVNDKVVKDNLSLCESAIAISLNQVNAGSLITDKPIKFIPHGVDREFFNEHGQNVLESKRLKLIVVARLLKLKNIELVLRSLADFKYDFIFDIYGDGPERDALQILIEQLGLKEKVQLKGRIDNRELPFIYKEYNVFVMPSFPESLGRVYFEAMASGLPVFASRNTGIDGLITDGNEGFLVTTEGASLFQEEFLSKLETLVQKEEQLPYMSKKAKEFARGYLWNEIIPKYSSIYYNK